MSEKYNDDVYLLRGFCGKRVLKGKPQKKKENMFSSNMLSKYS